MIKSGVLSNGIRVVTESVPNTPTVSVCYSVEIGSQNDPKAYFGLAHLLEHSLFLGSKSFSQKTIQQHDYLTGSTLNAETNQECTIISTDVLSEDLPDTLSLIADMTKNPLFPPQAVNREKKVVLNELKEVSEDDDMFADNMIYQAAFKGQPMQHPTEGYEESVKAVTPNILKKHHQKYAQPDKIIISISGHIDHDKMMSTCQKLFGQIQTTETLKPLPKPIYIGGDNRQAENMSSNVFRLGFNGVSLNEGIDNYVKVDLLASLLENALYDNLRHKKGLLYGIHADNIAYKHCAVFVISSSCLPKNTKDVIYGCAQIIGQIEKYITPQTLLAAKKSIKLDLCTRDTSVHEKASSNEFDMRYYNRIVPISEYFQKIDAVTVDDIQKIAARIFSSRLSFAGLGILKEMPSYKQITQRIEEARFSTPKSLAKQPIKNYLCQGRER